MASAATKKKGIYCNVKVVFLTSICNCWLEAASD